MTAEARKPEDLPTLGALARDALAAADGASNPAIDALVERLLRDRSLLRSIIGQIVRAAASDRTLLAVRNERHAIIQRATNSRSNVLALARGLSASLLDMPLAGGFRLRTCTRAMVFTEANRFDGLAKDCGRKARFLSSVAQSVPDGQTVGDVISDDRAIELWDAAA